MLSNLSSAIKLYPINTALFINTALIAME